MLKPVARELIDNEQALALVLRLPFLVGHLLFLNLDAVFVGKPAKRLGERHLLVLHQEARSIARLATSEALENSPRGIHVKRRRTLVVKRAKTDVVDASPAQLYEFRHYVNDLCRIENPVLCALVNHHGKSNEKGAIFIG